MARIAVIGHVEHVTVGRVPEVPRQGDIAHLETPTFFPGGGGGVAFFQLARSDDELHLFTALGDDEAGAQVEARLASSGAHVHAARRASPHTRDVVMIDPAGERTIVVVGRPLHPVADDALPWSILASCDAVYFTTEDPELLRRARAASRLVATARRKPALDAAGVRLDAILGSVHDPREDRPRGAYAPPPDALVRTEGAAGGVVETTEGGQRWAASPAPEGARGGAYGAGDSFAGAFVHHLARGAAAIDAARRAAPAGAAVLGALDTLAAQLDLRAP